MSEKLKVYIARDLKLDFRGDYQSDLFLFYEKPELEKNYFQVNSDSFLELPINLYPEIKNGDCYEAFIVLGEKL
jgi:hypothetical protein